MDPILIVLGWAFGALALGVLGMSGWLIWRWYEGWQQGAGPLLAWDLVTLGLLVAVAGIAWSVFGGRWARRKILRSGATGGGEGELPQEPPPGEKRYLDRPNGSRIAVETWGDDEDWPTLVLTSGWGPDRTEWYDLTARLRREYRIVLWDLPGLNESRGPDDRDYSLERMAGDLAAVVEAYGGGRRCVLLGHSIGGMVLLSFCRLYPELVERRVGGVGLCFTTYTDPLETMRGSRVWRWLEWPVVRPILVVTTWVSPVAWMLSVLSYLNGSAYRMSRRMGFTRQAPTETVEYVARYQVKTSPGIMARGALGMLSFDETRTLGKVAVPTLITAADQDWLTAPEASRFMHERIAGSTLVEFAPARHMAHLEYPRRFAQEVDRFAKACFAGNANGPKEEGEAGLTGQGGGGDAERGERAGSG